MFLCRDCEEFRFPTVNVTATDTNRNAPTRSKSSVDTGGNKKARNQKQKSKKSTKGSIDIDSDTDEHDRHAQCVSCLGAVDSIAKTTCAICAGVYHFACSSISDKFCQQFLDIAQYITWVCDNCRLTAQSSILKLRAEVSTLSSTILQLQSDMAQLQSDMTQKLNATITPHVHSLPSSDTPAAAVPAVEVERVIEDVNRRKRNVIITGLLEDNGVDDTTAFQQLCEDYLECKPHVVNSRRIGQHSPDKPRRLLVRLRDEQSASALLQTSRRLRSVDNDTVSKTIFINPDLTPAAAKLAFEERQKRRQRQQQKLAKSENDLDTSQSDAVISAVTDIETHTVAINNNLTHNASHPCVPSANTETFLKQLMSDDTAHTDKALETTSACSSSQHTDHTSALNPDAVPFLAS